MIWPNCCIFSISEPYKLVLLFSTRRSTICIQALPFNLHRNNLVEMSTVSTYIVLSFCTNCHFCFPIFFLFNVVFQKLYPEKSSSHSKSTPRQSLESNFQPLCHVKGVGRGTLWHITRWKTLVVVPYDTMSGERDWSWYRKTYC
jgi:hypothetical protein